LNFSLEVKSLEDKNLKYNALSYTWDPPLGTETSDPPAKIIIVNNEPFQVTENLYSALRHLQPDEICLGIWIDSVCIDQTNKVEQRDQIQRMRSIYDSATCVLIWLGPTANDSDCIMNLISTIGQQCFDLNLPELDSSGNQVWPDPSTYERRLKLRETLNELLNREGHLKIVKAFGAFCERRWWKRVWAVQELAVAQRVTFICGPKIVTHDIFDRALSFWQNWVEETVQQRAKIYTLNELKELDRDEFFHSLARGSFGLAARSMLSHRSKYQKRKSEDKSTTLYETLNQAYTHSSNDTTPLQATKDKDRIFALVGLVEQDYYETLGLALDYNVTPDSTGSLTEGEVVYMKIAEALLKAGYLDLLGLFQPGKIFGGNQTLPSWCPDWRKELWQSNAVNGNLGKPRYKASQTSKKNFSLSVQSNHEAKTITISGLLVGSITEVRPRLDKHKGSYSIDSDPQNNILPVCGELFSDTKELISMSKFLMPNAYTLHELDEAVWRVPVRDFELPPGTFRNKLPRRIPKHGDNLTIAKDTSNKVSEERYRTFLRLVRSFETFENLQNLFKNTNSENTVSKTIKISYLLPKSLFLLGTWAIARLHLISRCRWFVKNTILTAWTWASSRETTSALANLRKKMSIEWDNIVCDIPELYMLTMSTNYPMKLFMTRQGYIGLGPATLQKDDVVCILFGASTPLLLRPRILEEGQRGYWVIGEAYVYGIMDGEFLQKTSQDAERLELF